MEQYIVGGGLLAALIAFLSIRQQMRRRADEDERAAGGGEREPSVTQPLAPVRTAFKPSTLNLIRAMEWQKDRRYLAAREERYLLAEVLEAIRTAMYHRLDKETWKHGVWPVSPAIVSAARQALRDHHVGTYAAERLAWLLARAGAADDDVLEKLHPWDRLAFSWQREGLNAAAIAQILRDAALIDSIPAPGMAQIDGWIARPVSVLWDPQEIVEALFGKTRIVSMLVQDEDCDDPNHPYLFEQLLRSATSPVLVSELEQRRYGDAAIEPAETITLVERTSPEDFGDVLFTHAGQRYRFIFEDLRKDVDVASVMSAADRFLTDLGYPDRTFRFQDTSGGGQVGCFITAPEAAFRQVAERLHLPLCAP